MMHYFGIPIQTQLMIAYKMLTESIFGNFCSVKNCIVGMLLTCPITVTNYSIE